MAKTPPHSSSSAGSAAIPGAVAEADKVAGVLNLGAFAIGALAILATASEYFSEGRSPASVGLYRAYFAVLSASAGTRQARKWAAAYGTGAPEAPGAGHLFIGAWAGLYCVLFFHYAVIGLGHPVWPAHLLEAYGVVLGVYALGKASGHVRDAGRLPWSSVRFRAAKAVSPAEAERIHEVLGWSVDALGALCLADTAANVVWGGRWRSYTDLYDAFHWTLAAYAATRELGKWSAREAGLAPAPPRGGHRFVAVWLGLAAVVVFSKWADPANPPLWPPRLSETLAWVVGVWFAGKAAGRFGGPVAAGGGRAPGRPTPEPSDEPGAPPVRRPAHPEDYETVKGAARRLREFSLAELSAATRLAYSGTFSRHVDRMIREGLVVRLGRGRYRWIGP